MVLKEVCFGDVRVQLLGEGDAFHGLGEIFVGKTQVRGGDLPMRPFAETLFGLRFDSMNLLGIEQSQGGVIIRARWLAREGDWEQRLDHSQDRILHTGSWNGAVRASAELHFVLMPAKVKMGGRTFAGFSYSLRYQSDEHPIHLIVDRSTWELDGRISGCTYYGQLNFQTPTARYSLESEHSSEGLIDYPTNPVMTQAMPRWAGAPTVDYLFRGDKSLVMFYGQVGLIRSIMRKSAGEDCLKFFEQHYLDYNLNQQTVARHVLVECGSKSETDHRNLWTQWHDYTGNLARAEFDMQEPEYPTILQQNLWENFDFTSYDRDLLPAASALNFGQVFIDPVWENDMTKRRSGLLVNPGGRTGNMCCPWELEVAKILGGEAGLKSLVQRFHSAGVRVSSWISTHLSNLYFESKQGNSYVLKLPDGKHPYGSGYSNILGMDLNSDYSQYLLERAQHVRAVTGIDGYLWDSFYNFGFMPVSFRDMKPRTQFRACLGILAALQKMGYHMRIESLGPFGHPNHGVTAAYNEPSNEFIRYKGNFHPDAALSDAGWTNGQALTVAQQNFRLLSGRSQSSLPLFVSGKRLDQLADPLLSQANAVYKLVSPDLSERTLLEEGAAAMWQDAAGTRSTCWAFAAQTLKVPAGTQATDLIGGTVHRAKGDILTLSPYRIYQWAHKMPVSVTLGETVSSRGKGTRRRVPVAASAPRPLR